MKRLLIPAIALVVGLGMPAVAANAAGEHMQYAQDHSRDRNDQNRDKRNNSRENSTSNKNDRDNYNRRGMRTTTQNPADVVRQNSRNDNRNSNSRNNNNRRDTYNGRSNRGHDKFDRRAWQRNKNASRRYHAKRTWHKPRNWQYRRYTYGQILPNLFWGNDYRITSYRNYGLATPPYGYVWVRYGNEAALTDARTGTILQISYNQFY